LKGTYRTSRKGDGVDGKERGGEEDETVKETEGLRGEEKDFVLHILCYRNHDLWG
jgi:hypothetical protein